MIYVCLYLISLILFIYLLIINHQAFARKKVHLNKIFQVSVGEKVTNIKFIPKKYKNSINKEWKKFPLEILKYDSTHKY